MLAHHSQLSQYPGLIRSNNTYPVDGNQVLNLSTTQQYHQHQLQQQQLQQQQHNFPIGIQVQDSPNRPVQRVSPAIQNTTDPTAMQDQQEYSMKTAAQSSPVELPNPQLRRGSNDATTIEVPLSRYSSVLATALPTVTSDGNALAIKRKDFITSRKKREFIPDQEKDGSYWDKRRKNNEAAKRSREKRRLNDIVLEARVLDLTQESDELREKLYILAERFGIDDVDSLSPEELRNAPLVKVKEEPKTPPPEVREPLATSTSNDCIMELSESTLSERHQSHEFSQRHPIQLAQNSEAPDSVTEINSPTPVILQTMNSVDRIGTTPTTHTHTPIIGAESCHRGSSTHYSHALSPKSQTRPCKFGQIPTEVSSGLTIRRDIVCDPTNSVTGREQFQQHVVPALAQLYGMEQRPLSAASKPSQKPVDSMFPHLQVADKSNSMPSLLHSQELDLQATITRERTVSHCDSEDGALSTPEDKPTSPPWHCSFSNVESHKLPLKLRGKARRSATPPERSLSRDTSSPMSHPSDSELSPRALVIDIPQHRPHVRPVDVNGICTPPSSVDPEDLPESPTSMTCINDPINLQQTVAKTRVEPYAKMLSAAKKLAMVSTANGNGAEDTTDKLCKRPHHDEENNWPKRMRTDIEASHSQLAMGGDQSTQPSYLEYENSQLRNELKLLSKDVATLKNLIHMKVVGKE